MSNQKKCRLCGEPMQETEQVFHYHGSLGPCPKPPLHGPSMSDPLISDEEVRRMIGKHISLLCLGDAEHPEAYALVRAAVRHGMRMAADMAQEWTTDIPSGWNGERKNGRYDTALEIYDAILARASVGQED